MGTRKQIHKSQFKDLILTDVFSCQSIFGKEDDNVKICLPVLARLHRSRFGTADFGKISHICGLLPVLPGSHLQVLEQVGCPRGSHLSHHNL